MELIFQKSVKRRKGVDVTGPIEGGVDSLIENNLMRESAADLPEVSELDAVRHYVELSRRNFSVDTNFYPLGSCTMKYNPKILEKAASSEGFSNLHPLLGFYYPEFCAGALELLYRMQELLSEITGMHSTSLQPLAGAHGELAGMFIVKKYHKAKKNNKKFIIVPDESHGTNPASAAMAGYSVVTIPTGPDGLLDIDILKEKLTGETAAVVLTCPNTVGKFDPRIKEICSIAHEKDALMYYDGANMNAILGKVRPGDLGFDIVHLNLHKTFATPHGGGGPGAGPVGVTQQLSDYLPSPRIIKAENGVFRLSFDEKKSIGSIAPFYGNFSVILKAFIYILLLGGEGLKDAAEKAVLNANYVKKSLEDFFDDPYPGRCMHECVFSASSQGMAMNIAKSLIDSGIHPPTVYFPLIVKEALMIEPTETENIQTLDDFIKVMREISELMKKNPEELKKAPVSMPVGRLDEVGAARDPDVNYSS